MRCWVGLGLVVACAGTPSTKSDTGDDTKTGATTTTTSTTTEPMVRGGDAAAFVPYTMQPGEGTLDMAVLNMGSGVMLPDPRAEVEVMTDVFVTVGLGELEPPTFSDEVDWIGGVVASGSGLLPVELNGTVLNMWYMGPFDYHVDPGMGVRVVNTYGDLTDRSLELWVGIYETSTWQLAGPMTLDGDSLVLDGEVPVVSTMVLLDATGVDNPPEGEAKSGEGSLSGVITGSDGAPLEGARVQYCRGTECASATTDASGLYRIEGSESGPGSFEVIPNT